MPIRLSILYQLALVLIALSGCAGAPEAGPEHPANPAAAESPQRTVSETLSNPDRAETAPAAASVMYTCPMDPEVIRNQPGSCPICGMKLQPVTSQSGDHGGRHHE